jgi:hypothetical protein
LGAPPVAYNYILPPPISFRVVLRLRTLHPSSTSIFTTGTSFGPPDRGSESKRGAHATVHITAGTRPTT